MIDAEDVLYNLDIIRSVVLDYSRTGDYYTDTLADAINRLISVQCDLESLRDNK